MSRLNASGLTALAAVLAMQPAVAGEPSIGKMGIVFHLKPHFNKPEWTWTPSARFRVQGPLASSAVISVEYTLPNGKPFVKVQCENTYAIEANDSLVLNDCGFRQEDSAATNQTGTFGFQIKLSDELAGTNKTLYTGKFTVGKQLYNPTKLPASNKQFYYYVDNDWRLPLGYVGSRQTDIATEIYCEVWMKRPFIDLSKVRGYLFFNGKQVAENSGSFTLESTPPETPEWRYQLVQIKFQALTEVPPGDMDSWWKAYENPGEYEIKIMRDGKLARALKFTVGKDGKPIDAGAAKSNGVAPDGALVPVTVLGDGDGAWNKEAWKTDAFFKNPLTGF